MVGDRRCQERTRVRMLQGKDEADLFKVGSPWKLEAGVVPCRRASRTRVADAVTHEVLRLVSDDRDGALYRVVVDFVVGGASRPAAQVGRPFGSLLWDKTSTSQFP